VLEEVQRDKGRAGRDPSVTAAFAEWQEIRRRRAELGQDDREWSSKEAGREWVKLRSLYLRRTIS
jgi:hypothetical protein